MEILLHKNKFPQGTKYSIRFLWDSDKFVIRTYEKEFVVTDREIVIKDGKFYFNPSKQNPKYNPNEIEIPLNVIERKDVLNMDLKNRKGSISSIDHTEGKIYFSLNSDGQIVAKLKDREVIADNIETIENKKAINVTSLGLEFPFIEVPSSVENAFEKAKNIKIMEKCSLIYVGESQLTKDKHFFKLSQQVPLEEWQNVESLFENFGKGGSGLQGWLTSQPVKVQRILGLKHTNEHENDIQRFEDAITLIENLK